MITLLRPSCPRGRGLGTALLGKVIRYCRSRHTRRLTADVLAHNTGMLRLAYRHGFRKASVQRGTIHLTLDL